MGIPIKLDYRLAMSCAVGRGGLHDSELEGLLSRARSETQALVGRGQRDEVGFVRLPADESILSSIDAALASLPPGLTDIVVLGVGGSSLGARAAYEALASRLASAAPRLHFPDNADPARLAELLTVLAPPRTLFVFVSKSGGTLETAAQILIALEWLDKALTSSAREHIVAITDPTSGALRELVRARNLRHLPIPSNVGGRFSVLTAAGLFPLAVAGLDVRAMMHGAASMMRASEVAESGANPAALLASLLVAHMEHRGNSTHVFMPYADALRTFGAWFVQLWAESLGKRFDMHGALVERGPTPIAAIGSTDQHAQVQLFAEGPRDKVVCFVRVETPTGADLIVPATDGPFGFLSGTSMHRVVLAQQEGTALALACDERPSLTIGIETLDEEAVGALFYLLEFTTAVAGGLLSVDPFDQPGVERGKRITLGMLGSPTPEAEAARARLAQADDRHQLPVR